MEDDNNEGNSEIFGKSVTKSCQQMMENAQQSITEFFGSMSNDDEEGGWNWCTMIVWRRYISQEAYASLECNGIR